METKIIVTGAWFGFEKFELGELKYIPRKGEHFDIDENKYKEQAEIIAIATERTGGVCRVGIVIHAFRDNQHEIEIHLHCGELND
jgi:hypothetical protein